MDSKVASATMRDSNEEPKGEACPMCGGGIPGMAYGGGISDDMSDLDMNAHNDAIIGDPKVADVEEGDEDQNKARKARLEGVLDGIRKRHTGR